MNLLIIDAGHCEKVAGKEAPDKSLREWEFNNDMQYKLKKRCEDHNINVYLTNPSPTGKDEIGLSKRAELANTYYKSKNKPKSLFVSLHANAHLSTEFTSARGTETFIANNASQNSKNASKYINTEIFNTIKAIDPGAKDRGVKTENFTVIHKAAMPAILVEYAFYTNHSDLKILKNNRNELVEATVRGICKYFGIEYRAISNSNTTNNKEIWYRAVAGSFKTKDAAEKRVKELTDKGYSGCFVVAFEK